MITHLLNELLIDVFAFGESISLSKRMQDKFAERPVKKTVIMSAT